MTGDPAGPASRESAGRSRVEADAPPAGELAALAKRVEELEGELRQLRTPALPAPAHGWDPDAPPPRDDDAVSYAWLTWLEPKYRPRPRVPRLPFQVLFLAGCAAAAALADIEAIWIAAVMGAAWFLVALTEMIGARADRRRRAEEAALPVRFAAAPDALARADPAWFTPPVEQTIVGQPTAAGVTAVTRIGASTPPPPAETTVSTEPPPAETTVERARHA